MPRFFTLVAAASLASLSLTALPAVAGQAETAYLQQLSGNWTGSGKLSGADDGTVSCRVTFKPSGQRVNYSGRCNLTGVGSQSLTGSISYNDAKKQYEAKASGGTAIGKKSGQSLTFASTNRTIAGTVTSNMTLSPTRFVIDFSLTTSKGEKTASKITFRK